MRTTCTQCGDPIDHEAWPIIVVEAGDPAVFCDVTCHDRWRNGRTDRPAPPTQ